MVTDADPPPGVTVVRSADPAADAPALAGRWGVAVHTDPERAVAEARRRDRVQRARAVIAEGDAARRLVANVASAASVAPDPPADPVAGIADELRSRSADVRRRERSATAAIHDADLIRRIAARGPADLPAIDEVRAVGAELHEAESEANEARLAMASRREPATPDKPTRTELRRLTRSADRAAFHQARARLVGGGGLAVVVGLGFMLIGSETAPASVAIAAVVVYAAVALALFVVLWSRRRRAEAVERAAYTEAGLEGIADLEASVVARREWEALVRELRSREAVVEQLVQMWHGLVGSSTSTRLDVALDELRWSGEARRLLAPAERRAEQKRFEALQSRRRWESAIERLGLARHAPEQVDRAVAELEARTPPPPPASAPADPADNPGGDAPDNDAATTAAATTGPDRAGPLDDAHAAALRAVLRGRPLHLVVSHAEEAARWLASIPELPDGPIVVVDPAGSVGSGRRRALLAELARLATQTAIVIVSAEDDDWARWSARVTGVAEWGGDAPAVS